MNKLSDPDFDKCVTVTRNKSTANYIFRCKKGLWAVESYSSPKARREAMHYFLQYKADGEYHDLIGGPSIEEVFLGAISGPKSQ